ncbi:hypothetical protein RLIN73S_01375 [Rhodanobacter lindaniclasticus]
MALVLTVGAAISILGTNSNTIMFGPRYLLALADDGIGPALRSRRIHPRFLMPAIAVVVVGVASVILLSGSFVQLALLSVVARLFGYLATAVAVLVLRKHHGHRPGAMHLPGGPAIPIAATLLSLALLASAGVANLVAAAIALLAGALIYRLPPDIYDPAFINADVDLAGIAERLKDTRSARLCLDRPPGNGQDGLWPLAGRATGHAFVGEACFDLMSPGHWWARTSRTSPRLFVRPHAMARSSSSTRWTASCAIARAPAAAGKPLSSMRC